MTITEWEINSIHRKVIPVVHLSFQVTEILCLGNLMEENGTKLQDDVWVLHVHQFRKQCYNHKQKRLERKEKKDYFLRRHSFYVLSLFDIFHKYLFL